MLLNRLQAQKSQKSQHPILIQAGLSLVAIAHDQIPALMEWILQTVLHPMNFFAKDLLNIQADPSRKHASMLTTFVPPFEMGML